MSGVSTLVEPAFCHCPDYHQTFGAEVADLAELAGFAPDPEQRLALDMIFAVDRRGKAAAFEFCAVCCRQNLKTGLFKQAALGWLFITEERLIVWSAHEFNTAQEAHRDMAALIDGCSYLSRRVKQIYNSAADRSIELMSGQRLVFKARTSTGGRGLSAPKVVLDEAFALRPEHMGALLPTLSAQPDPQVLYGSSAGMAGSDVLRGIRDRGRAGRGRLAYVEWCSLTKCDSELCSHLPGEEGCALDRVENWQAANPLLGRTRANGTGLTVEYVQAERDAMPPLEFARERLGWWDEPESAGEKPILLDDWKLTARDARPTGDPVFFVTVAKEMRSASVAVAVVHDGVPHVELADHRPGTAWLTNRLRQLQQRHPAAKFGAFAAGPVKSWTPTLAELGITLELLSGPQTVAACAHLQKLVQDAAFTHSPDAVVDDSVRGAEKRDLDGAGWVWDWRRSTSDVAPIAAETGALWLLESTNSADVWGFWE